MVGGRGVKLAPSSGVMQAELFIAVDVDAGQTETIVRQASGVDRAWLPADRQRESVEVEFDEVTGRVVAWKRVRFDDLVIEERAANPPDGDRVTAVLVDAALRQRDRVLPSTDSDAGRFRTRVRCLRAWMPDLGLPEYNDSDLRETTAWLAPGCRSLDELRKRDWEEAFRARLTHSQRQAVDREAPERIEVPSGSHIAVNYEEGRPPVLAVRIQEVFGLVDTPRLAGGRVKVLLQLLAPNYRPQQVTDNLASFWANTYPVVRKELRGAVPEARMAGRPALGRGSASTAAQATDGVAYESDAAILQVDPAEQVVRGGRGRVASVDDPLPMRGRAIGVGHWGDPLEGLGEDSGVRPMSRLRSADLAYARED